MAEEICLKFRRGMAPICEKFLLADEEEYLVKMFFSGNYFQRVKIVLKWNKCSDLFLRTSIYTDTDLLYSYRKTLIVNNGKYASMNASLSLSSDNNILLISIVHVKSCGDRLSPYNFKETTLVKKAKEELAVVEKLEDLSKDMKDLFRSGYHSDIILTDETNEIRAHKLILSARSTVFAKMFEHEMRENLENVVIIKDISIDVLKKLLDFMYTGQVEIKNMTETIDLCLAADKYDIKGLKKICLHVLREIDLNNILPVIVTADLLQDEELKQAALVFIRENYSQVKDLQLWGDFLKEKMTLAIEVLCFVAEGKLQKLSHANEKK